jgi:hypothetical protein
MVRTQPHRLRKSWTSTDLTQTHTHTHIHFFLLFRRCGLTHAMAYSFLRFLDYLYTQGRITLGRTPLDEWSARRRNLYETTHNTYKRQISMPPAGLTHTHTHARTHARTRTHTHIQPIEFIVIKIVPIYNIIKYNIYLLHMGWYPVAVFILHVYRMWIYIYISDRWYRFLSKQRDMLKITFGTWEFLFEFQLLCWCYWNCNSAIWFTSHRHVWC